MKNLDDFFKENREEFNDIELPEGHEQRFLNKLEKQKKVKPFKYWYSIAAGMALIGILTFFAKEQLPVSIENGTEAISLGDVSEKYLEVEEFYKAGVNQKIEEIDKLKCKINDEQKSMIDTELMQLKTSYKMLQAELKLNRNDERIINAMITNYQNRIRFLEQVIYQIKANC